jgi:hypothetical protein
MELIRKAWLVSTVVLFMLIGIGYAAEPFGLRMGMTLQEIRAAGGNPEETDIQGRYKLTKVPKPHSDFDIFYITVAPKTGLIDITAAGKLISTSAYGTELKSQFENMVQRLSAIYGKATTFDFLRVGSIWNEPNDWMMGLLKKERRLTAFWSRKEDSSMSDDIGTIMLDTVALSHEKGCLRLGYQSIDFEKGQEELTKTEDSAL